jgi:hypothetical protein
MAVSAFGDSTGEALKPLSTTALISKQRDEALGRLRKFVQS